MPIVRMIWVKEHTMLRLSIGSCMLSRLRISRRACAHARIARSFSQAKHRETWVSEMDLLAKNMTIWLIEVRYLADRSEVPG